MTGPAAGVEESILLSCLIRALIRKRRPTFFLICCNTIVQYACDCFFPQAGGRGEKEFVLRRLPESSGLFFSSLFPGTGQSPVFFHHLLHLPENGKPA